MLDFLKWVKNCWKHLNMLQPETRSVLIILLFGLLLYSQINQSTFDIIDKRIERTFMQEKSAEEYARATAMEVSRQVKLIAFRDTEAFDVLLLSYHNSKQNLQGYKFLYLSCLTEVTNSIEEPLIGKQWTNLDYIYYVDELQKIHNQRIVFINNMGSMKKYLPKLYRLVKASDAQAAAFYTIEGKTDPTGIVVCLYKQAPNNNIDKVKIITPYIQRLALLLNYEER